MKKLDTIQVVLADDNSSIRELTERLLPDDLEVVASVANGAALIEEALVCRPDLIILDIDMPVMGGLEAARKFRQIGVTAEIIVLTVSSEKALVQESQKAGARGYVIKSRMGTDLLESIRKVLSGQTYVSPGIDS